MDLSSISGSVVLHFYSLRMESTMTLNEFLSRYHGRWLLARGNGVSEIDAILHLITCLPDEWQDWASFIVDDYLALDLDNDNEIDPIGFINAIFEQNLFYGCPPFVYSSEDEEEDFELEPMDIDPFMPDTPEFVASPLAEPLDPLEPDWQAYFQSYDYSLISHSYYSAYPEMFKMDMGLNDDFISSCLNPNPIHVVPHFLVHGIPPPLSDSEAGSSRPLGVERSIDDELGSQPSVGVIYQQPVEHDQSWSFVYPYPYGIEECMYCTQANYAPDHHFPVTEGSAESIVTGQTEWDETGGYLKNLKECIDED